MRIVVTGAFGFIGQHLLMRLDSLSPSQVVLLSRSFTKEQSKIIDNLPYKCQVIVGDVEDSLSSDSIQNPDVFIHLAWASTPSMTGTDFNLDYRLNWPSSSKTISFCIKNNTKLIFLSSGGTVYGNPNYIPIDENHPNKPISAYGKVKLLVENEIVKNNIDSGLEYIILRPSNTYGSGYNTNKGYGVIGHWVDQIIEGKPVKILGDGSIKRDFIHIDDLIDVITKSVLLKNGIYNVGSNSSISLINLLDLISSLLSHQAHKIYGDLRSFDVLDNQLDIRKIKSQLDFRPRPLIEGLSFLKDYYLRQDDV